jgi:hypothetical protein
MTRELGTSNKGGKEAQAGTLAPVGERVNNSLKKNHSVFL